MKMISKSALLILVLAILYLLISGNLFSTYPLVIAGQLFAIGLSIWARKSFIGGKFSIHAQPVERPLLLSGPYKYIRHPMYTAALLFIWSSILGHLSIINIIIGLVVTGIIVIRIIVEEHFLNEYYADYTDYSVKTRRIIPFII